jgi:hypothetical protein
LYDDEQERLRLVDAGRRRLDLYTAADHIQTLKDILKNAEDVLRREG